MNTPYSTQVMHDDESGGDGTFPNFNEWELVNVPSGSCEEIAIVRKPEGQQNPGLVGEDTACVG